MSKGSYNKYFAIITGTTSRDGCTYTLTYQSNLTVEIGTREGKIYNSILNSLRREMIAVFPVTMDDPISIIYYYLAKENE